MRMRPLALVLLLAAAAPLAAAEPSVTVSAADTEAGSASASASLAERDRNRPVSDRHCLRETGTRIRLRGERRACAPYAGRVWSREDLDSTGQVDIGTALKMLDVSIR